MNAGVEHLEVTVASGTHVTSTETGGVGLLHQGGKVGHLLGTHAGGIVEVLVAQCGQTSIIDHALDAQPPLAQQRGNKRGNETTDVDEHIEDLEARVAAFLDLLDFLSALALGNSVGLHVVIHLTHDSLQVALEQTVTKGNQEQGHAGEHQQPHVVTSRVDNGNREQHIAESHDHKTPLDGALVVLGAVGNETAHETQHVDTSIEDGIDDSCNALVKAKL